MNSISNTVTNENAAEKANAPKRVFFEPRKWSFNKECAKNKGNRSFMHGPDGEIREAYMIGDWTGDWTEIISETLLLEKNTTYLFTFWLNGGENDRNDEVCRFEVILNNDHENRYTYNLNRSYIKPLKKLNGWELYEIPFVTQNNEFTQLKFVAQRAYLTVMSAKSPEEYASIPDAPDPFEEYRPQRHNLIFEDGFPANSNCWYSTKTLTQKYGHRLNLPKLNHDMPKASEAKGYALQAGEGSVFPPPEIKLPEIKLEADTDVLVKLVTMLTEKVEALGTQISDIVGSMNDITSNTDELVDELEELRDEVEELSDKVDEVTDHLDDIMDNDN